MSHNYRLMPKPGLVPVVRQPKTTNSVRSTLQPRQAPQNTRLAVVSRAKPAQQPQKQKVQERPRETPQKQQAQAPARQAPLPPRQKFTKVVSQNGGNRYQPRQVQLPAVKGGNTQAPTDNNLKKIYNVGTGRILVITACGPSMKQVDIAQLQNHPMIDIVSINKPDKRIHPTNYWAFCDQSQYVRNKEAFESYTGILINPVSVRARHKNQVLIKVRQGAGFSKDLNQGYYIGRSSTYAMMQVAYYMNYDKIFIFGCDMSSDENGAMWSYGDNPDVSADTRNKRFEKEAEHYLHGAKLLTEQERAKYVFCSSYLKWEFVKHYQQLDHKLAVAQVLQLANSMNLRK